MEKNKYQKIVEKHKPTEDRITNGLKAFIIGGIMGIIGQLLLEFYSYILEIPIKELLPVPLTLVLASTITSLPYVTTLS